MKGIILAGGSGTRLYPLTKAVSKQLLPVYDKPMVYYPLATLMLAGIREILLISTPKDLPIYQELLGDGNQLGLSIRYAEQPRPEGLAQAFIIGKDFLANEPACLILGDNVFYGHGMSELLRGIAESNDGATILGYRVKNPERYGIVEFDKDMKVVSLEEKPNEPKSDYAIPGIYFYDSHVCDYAESLKPSKRGELEITDLNMIYLEREKLNLELLGRGMAWLDTGTHESLMQASNFIEAVEQRQGLKVACLEEIAYRMGYINKVKLRKLAEPMRSSDYGEYLVSLLEGEL